MTKRIWWLNHHAVPPVVPGGTRHFSLARSLEKLNYETTIINGSFDHLNSNFVEKGAWGDNLKEPMLRSYDGVDFYSIPTPSYEVNASFRRVKNMFAYYFGAMKYLRGNVDVPKPDLIIGSVVHPFAAYAGYRLSKYYKVPFVYEVRDLWPRTLVELGRISSKHPFVILLNKLDGFLAKKAKLIITTAPLMKDHYKEHFGIAEEKCLWVTNGTAFTKNTPSPMREIEENNVIEVGYTGAIGLANGIKDFLEALNNVSEDILKRFKFTFIGEGPLKQELSSYAQDKRLPVEFRNSVTKDKVWEELNKFDMLLIVLLSTGLYRHGISMNKMADYHAAARPIIMIGKAAENPVLISRSGYVTDQMNGLSTLLKNILNDSTHNYELKASLGRKYALDCYDWDKLALVLKEKLDLLFV